MLQHLWTKAAAVADTATKAVAAKKNRCYIKNLFTPVKTPKKKAKKKR
jgi:hypothetical protein